MEKAVASHSGTRAWKIPWMEEPGRLQSMGSLWVGHDWAISLSLFSFMHWRRKWQPTPVFLPGESQGWGAWWAAVYGVAQSRTRLKRLSSSSSSLVIPNYFFLKKKKRCMAALGLPICCSSPVVGSRGYSSCCGQASHFGGFFCVKPGPGRTGFSIVVLGLSSCGSWGSNICLIIFLVLDDWNEIKNSMGKGFCTIWSVTTY